MTGEGSGVQVQDPAGLGGEGGVAGEDPRPDPPGLDRVSGQPPPDGGARHRRGDALGCCLAGQVRAVPPGQRHPGGSGQLAGQGLDRDDHLRGGTPGAAVRAAGRPGPPGVARRTGSATWRPPAAGCPAGRRSSRCPGRRRRTARSSPATRPGTVTYTGVLQPPGGGARLRSGRCGAVRTMRYGLVRGTSAPFAEGTMARHQMEVWDLNYVSVIMSESTKTDLPARRARRAASPNRSPHQPGSALAFRWCPRGT